MKRKEVLVLIGEVLGSRAVYSVASLVITITMLSGITIILRNDIRDIKNYVQSVVDGDPNYKEIHSQVRGSENVIRGNIDVEALFAKEDKKAETTSTANNISGGYDNYTPTQTITDDISNRPSNNLNNSTTGETTVADNNNSNNLNNSTNEVNNSNNTSNNNSDEDKKEDVLDRSSFNGKDIMISEGEPFNPMNGLQLAATDINGKNITNKIVIKENNVDTYKPGLYTVKASVELSDKSNLEKEFFVRVEPTVLNLVVNDVKTSKDILEKNEEFNLNFSVKSSKSYLEVVSININDKDYDVRKTVSNNFFKASDKYEVNLVAPSKGGVEKIQIKSITMSDGTVIDIDKSIDIEVLRENAYLSDVVIEDKSNEKNIIGVSFNLNDTDNTVSEPRICVYNENDDLIIEEYILKDNNSLYTKVSRIINVSDAGQYTIKVLANKNNEEIQEKYEYNEIELLSEKISINNKKIAYNEEIDIQSINLNLDDEEVENYNLNKENDLRSRSINGANENLEIITSEKREYEISIKGNVLDYNNEIKPGTIEISIPTKTSFRVNKDGIFTAPSINIRNNGQEAIDVYVYKFIDRNGLSGINITNEKDIIDNQNDISRNNMSLSISGDTTAYFKSNNSMEDKSGVYQDLDLTQEVKDGIKILKIYEGASSSLHLNAKIGKRSLGTDVAITDIFTLILKIRKSEKN